MADSASSSEADADEVVRTVLEERGLEQTLEKLGFGESPRARPPYHFVFVFCRRLAAGSWHPSSPRWKRPSVAERNHRDVLRPSPEIRYACREHGKLSPDSKTTSY